MRHTIKTGLAAALLLVSFAGQSEVSVPYDRTGQLDGVDVAGQGMVINDQYHRLGHGIPVYSSGGRSMSIGQLQVGQAIGFTTTGFRPETVTGVWVLRSGESNVE